MTISTFAPASLAFFSAPWEPFVERRGDALGLRALADEFADAVTPGMSGRVRDGRWITILSWCLVHAHEVHTAADGGLIDTRAQQRARYAWLRPLELLWIARTIRLAADFTKRPLPGRRGVKRWCEGSRKQARNFGLSDEQFDRYRQGGIYGAYRVALRKWPGLTQNGNGWTPGPEAHRLAKWLDDKLGDAKPGWRIDSSGELDGPSRRSVLAGRSDPASWWLREWDTFDAPNRAFESATLPRPRDEFSALPERKLLQPVVFGEDWMGRRRHEIAHSIAQSTASDLLGLCDHLSSAHADRPVVRHLADFARLLHAGISLMDCIAISMSEDKPKRSLDSLVRQRDVKPLCTDLFEASAQWLKHAEPSMRHASQARQLAETIHSATPSECVAALIRHHEQHGSGKRWFVLRDGQVLLRTPQRGLDGLNWFRLGALSRLALQVGETAAMPRALMNDIEIDDLPEDDANVD